MKFPSWKKEKPTTPKEEEKIRTEENPTRITTESSQKKIDEQEMAHARPPQINIEMSEGEQKSSTKFEDNKSYILKIISKSGLPLVLRSEQNITIQEETKNEIISLLEENTKLMKEVADSNAQAVDDDEYLLRTANFHYLQGNAEKSIDLYEVVLKRNPTKMTALNNKGVVLDSKGNYDAAIECFTKALNSVPENVHVLCNKGISLYKNGKYDEALECFDLVLKFDANYVKALTFKGHTLYRLGKNNDALSCYSKVIRLEQNNAEALYNKACLCSLKGDEYGALTSLERAIRLDSSWKEVAAKDNDLERVRSNPRFSELVQLSN